jgi:DNA-binding NarL/FixJ family response regulator
MRIVIAHGDGLMFVGVKQALGDDASFDLVGEAHDGSEVLPLVSETEPDVVLLDMEISGLNALELLTRLRIQHPEVKVVVCSLSADQDVIQTTFEHGACGYIVESINPADLGAAIRRSVEYMDSMPPPRSMFEEEIEAGPALTHRETEVVEAVARGLANKAIAAELSVTVQTVKFHLTSAYRKLGVTNRTEAARWALHHGVGS